MPGTIPLPPSLPPLQDMAQSKLEALRTMLGRSSKLAVALAMGGLVPWLLAMIQHAAPINRVKILDIVRWGSRVGAAGGGTGLGGEGRDGRGGERRGRMEWGMELATHEGMKAAGGGGGRARGRWRDGMGGEARGRGGVQTFGPN